MSSFCEKKNSKRYFSLKETLFKKKGRNKKTKFSWFHASPIPTKKDTKNVHFADYNCEKRINLDGEVNNGSSLWNYQIHTHFQFSQAFLFSSCIGAGVWKDLFKRINLILSEVSTVVKGFVWFTGRTHN